MNYEKKYNEALERMKSWVRGEHPEYFTEAQKAAEYIFPELKESEDEKIRKAILALVRQSSEVLDKQNQNNMIAWLEKQGEQKPYGQRKECSDCQFNYAGECKGSCQMKRGEQKSADSYCQESCKGFQETGKCFADGDCKAKREAESVDKFKPKFHEGEWLCVNKPNGYARFVKIIKVVDVFGKERYKVSRDYDSDLDVVECDFIEKNYHLWTISDAKDGDVLATNKGGIFIYAKILYNKPYAYCGVDKFGVFKDNCLGSNWANSVDNIHPATKAQRDTLMKAMADAGYTFDFESKELKKLGQSEVTKTSDQEEIAEIPFGAKDSELQEATYYIPKGFHAEIDDDKVVIKKGEKPTAWSEEDEQITLSIEQAMNCISLLNVVPEKIDKIRTWLKSLKQRCTWKLSEE